MVSIGLVLGAGGVRGGAFHAGALAALAETTGWDPRSAALTVGTSAGAHTAATLRAGLSAADHLARATDRPLSAEGAALTAAAPGRLRLPDPSEAGSAPPWACLPQAPWLLGPAMLRPGITRWGVAAAGMLPAGRLPTSAMGQRVRAVQSGRWPDEPTWVVAYRTGDGRRAVFGRDDIDVPDLATAVEASSAVPARFRPVRIGKGRYIDGAVFSPSNADLVASLGFDLVIVSSAMTASADAIDRGPGLGARAQRWFAALLAREVAAIEAEGTAVLTLEPDAAVLAAIRAEGDDHDLSPAVAVAAHRSILERLDDAAVAPARSLLSS
ncbi:MAG: patatin-like phospholipase family protein [Acidimicrobiales bacterium]